MCRCHDVNMLEKLMCLQVVSYSESNSYLKTSLMWQVCKNPVHLIPCARHLWGRTSRENFSPEHSVQSPTRFMAAHSQDAIQGYGRCRANRGNDVVKGSLTQFLAWHFFGGKRRQKMTKMNLLCYVGSVVSKPTDKRFTHAKRLIKQSTNCFYHKR